MGSFMPGSSESSLEKKLWNLSLEELQEAFDAIRMFDELLLQKLIDSGDSDRTEEWIRRMLEREVNREEFLRMKRMSLRDEPSGPLG
jgi:hypothetical protein